MIYTIEPGNSWPNHRTSRWFQLGGSPLLASNRLILRQPSFLFNSLQWICDHYWLIVVYLSVTGIITFLSCLYWLLLASFGPHNQIQHWNGRKWFDRALDCLSYEWRNYWLSLALHLLTANPIPLRPTDRSCTWLDRRPDQSITKSSSRCVWLSSWRSLIEGLWPPGSSKATGESSHEKGSFIIA
jgi:hypothetical protein